MGLDDARCTTYSGDGPPSTLPCSNGCSDRYRDAPFVHHLGCAEFVSATLYSIALVQYYYSHPLKCPDTLDAFPGNRMTNSRDYSLTTYSVALVRYLDSVVSHFNIKFQWINYLYVPTDRLCFLQNPPSTVQARCPGQYD